MKKPLKRFAQCGSLTTFFIVFVIMFSLSSTALTTFGISKPNNNAPPAATPPPPKGKECSTNQDCFLMVDTSCVKDYEQVNRCLCGNYDPPRNGKCDDGPKGVRHRCSHDNDCDEYMICKENNGTNSKGTFVGSYNGRGNSMVKEKICMCDEEKGYMENIIEKHCSAAVRNFMAGVGGYIVAIILYFTITQKFLTY